jgi:succinate dehydrogenase hydrophobic anchor subunit
MERTERVGRGETVSGAGGLLGGFVGQSISGVALLVLLTLHMIAQHFVVPDGLRRYADVIAILGSPLMVVLEMAFLVFVTWHALLGLRAIVFDFGFSARAERTITWLFVVVGVATIAYGSWLLWTIVNAG